MTEARSRFTASIRCGRPGPADSATPTSPLFEAGGWFGAGQQFHQLFGGDRERAHQVAAAWATVQMRLGAGALGVREHL
ncbi:MAG TPA: hypothetical protein VE196_04790 [Pseudonocardiaceae bacterium]|nr:hypothetical protein [Pseudonocardiaceae bacterium]